MQQKATTEKRAASQWMQKARDKAKKKIQSSVRTLKQSINI